MKAKQFSLLAVFISQFALFQNSYGCVSNASEINRQVAVLTASYDNRISQLRSQQSSEILQRAGTNWAAQQAIRSKYNTLVNDLILSRDRDISNLKSRIVEVCEEAVTEVSPSTIAVGDAAALVDALTKLSELHKAGVLTDDEFQQAKRRALGLD